MAHCLNASKGCVMWGSGGVKQCDCGCDVCTKRAKWSLDTVTRVLDINPRGNGLGVQWVDVERPRIWRANPDDRCRCGRH